MSRAILNRLAKLEALNLNLTTTMTVRRHGDDAALFSRTIRYLDAAVIVLAWPEREEVVDSLQDHSAPEVEGNLVQHRYTDAAI